MSSRYHSTSFGWIGSIVLHAIVAVALYYSVVQPKQITAKYIEITLGSLPGGQGSLTKFTLPNQSDVHAGIEQTSENLNNPVTLPTRTLTFGTDDIIRLPATKKSVNVDPSAPLSMTNKISPSRDDKRTSSYYTPTPGRKEGPMGIQSGGNSGTGITPGNGGNGKGGFGSGDGIGDNVSFGVQWVNGPNRKLISGDAPVYPSGVNISAQIKLRVFVLADGSVRSATPAQKGDTRLENSAINKVKLWRFEPLPGGQSQTEQTCTIIFNFTLK